ncbi:hypothetical protein BC832DRAFT_126267 [Gaertneriomyces semiglobifer]|nr:hypothetical protein BC832DRAFT_126267 [Gaertneriomyces semiglobifer]
MINSRRDAGMSGHNIVFAFVSAPSSTHGQLPPRFLLTKRLHRQRNIRTAYTYICSKNSFAFMVASVLVNSRKHTPLDLPLTRCSENANSSGIRLSSTPASESASFISSSEVHYKPKLADESFVLCNWRSITYPSQILNKKRLTSSNLIMLRIRLTINDRDRVVVRLRLGKCELRSLMIMSCSSIDYAWLGLTLDR